MLSLVRLVASGSVGTNGRRGFEDSDALQDDALEFGDDGFVNGRVGG